MDRLNKAEHTDIVKVPYKGGGEVVNAVLGGNTPIAVLALSNMVSLLQSGRITRLRWCPIRARRCFPMCRPEGNRPAPSSRRRGSACSRGRRARPIVEKVARDVDRIMAEPAFRKRMYTDRGVEPAGERLDVFAGSSARSARSRGRRQGIRPEAEVTASRRSDAAACKKT